MEIRTVKTRQWKIDSSFCFGEYEDFELYRHNNHSVVLSRYVGEGKEQAGDWSATVRVSKNGGDFGEPRYLTDAITKKLVSFLESEAV